MPGSKTVSSFLKEINEEMKIKSETRVEVFKGSRLTLVKRISTLEKKVIEDSILVLGHDRKYTLEAEIWESSHKCKNTHRLIKECLRKTGSSKRFRIFFSRHFLKILFMQVLLELNHHYSLLGGNAIKEEQSKVHSAILLKLITVFTGDEIGEGFHQN
ncbi:hypothetical protein Tco_0152441 [Tanacetum coccineum]